MSRHSTMIKGNEIEEQWQKTGKKLEKTTEITIKKKYKETQSLESQKQKNVLCKRKLSHKPRVWYRSFPTKPGCGGRGERMGCKTLVLKMSKNNKKKAWES